MIDLDHVAAGGARGGADHQDLEADVAVELAAENTGGTGAGFGGGAVTSPDSAEEDAFELNRIGATCGKTKSAGHDREAMG
jgi:hypothetical protein